ncbi:hypothetical protein KAJ61_03600 [Candidatus Parcubacteria bacterium]|nr:hypothetical protein [Candidatus Parcubacteria bacterium]
MSNSQNTRRVIAHIKATGDILECILKYKPQYSAKHGNREERTHTEVVYTFLESLSGLQYYAPWILKKTEISKIINALNEIRNRFLNNRDLRKEIENIIANTEQLV